MENTVTNGAKATIEYDDQTPRLFLIATVVWALVAMAVGTLVASQLNYWKMNFNLTRIVLDKKYERWSKEDH